MRTYAILLWVLIGLPAFGASALAAAEHATPPTEPPVAAPVEAVVTAPAGPASHGMPHLRHGARYVLTRGEVMAVAALSMQPLPIDFGNLYVGNWRFGVLSTGVQAGILTAGTVLLVENLRLAHRRTDGDDRLAWSSGHRNALYGLAGGYVLSKLVSTWVAVGTASEQAGLASVALHPDWDGQRLGLSARIRLP